VLSIAIFDSVEQLRYADAHRYSLWLLAISFAAVLLLHAANRLGKPRE
jgi:ABC-type molybdate transport system permease subunit